MVEEWSAYGGCGGGLHSCFLSSFSVSSFPGFVFCSFPPFRYYFSFLLCDCSVFFFLLFLFFYSFFFSSFLDHILVIFNLFFLFFPSCLWSWAPFSFFLLFFSSADSTIYAFLSVFSLSSSLSLYLMFLSFSCSSFHCIYLPSFFSSTTNTVTAFPLNSPLLHALNLLFSLPLSSSSLIQHSISLLRKYEESTYNTHS